MREAIRVLYLSDTGGRMGGAAYSLLSLIRRLDRSAVAPYALLGSDGDFADALRGLGVDVEVSALEPIVRSYNPFSILRSIRRLIAGAGKVRRVVREKSIRIIHANDNTVVFHAVVPAMLTGSKSVWHVRSPVQRLGRVGAFLVKHSDALVFCSDSNAAPFRKFFPKYTQKVFVACEGVDAPALVEQSQRPSIRQEYDIPPDVPLVGIVGRITRIKGQDEFLKAAVIVSKLEPKVRFVVVGAPVAGSREALEADSAYADEIKQLAGKLSVADKTIFTGYRHDAPAVMKDLTVLAVPSRREGLGLVALEAMALGVPVVVSSAGGLPELVTNEVNGLVVPPNAAGALGLAIVRLLENRQLAKRLAEEGRKTAARFTADAHAKIVSDVYRLIAGGRA
ncbi:MAG TPA: glycosyltransferase family 4 protein [Planctomycetota bacterium]|nr:glycosyltransferase family 4 protein [Planctomycetota bacterium]